MVVDKLKKLQPVEEHSKQHCGTSRNKKHKESLKVSETVSSSKQDLEAAQQKG